MRRWLLFFLALAAALAALVLLRPFGLGDAPPMHEIDEDSRARLERVIREADSTPGDER